MMKFLTTFTAISASVTLVAAQTPSGFNVSTSTSMSVIVQPANVSISTPGMLVAQSGVSSAPTLFLPTSLISSQGPFCAIMIDNDVDFWHWLAPNLYANSSGILVSNVTGTNASPAVGASYFPPTPPANSGPHTYVVLLFQQPDDWQIPSYFSVEINPPPNEDSRFGISIQQFVSASNLGSPIAANYFEVANGTVSGVTSTAGASTTTTGTSVTAMASTTLPLSEPSSVATSTGSVTSGSASASSTGKSSASGKIGQGAGLLSLLAGVIALFM